MSGIVGYVGSSEATPLLLTGLSKVEYRGYDSAGVAVVTDKGIEVKKTLGRLLTLNEILDGGKNLCGTVGIAHTRWATHGEPSDTNAQPHFSSSENFAIVHNGNIENYLKLKESLIKSGFHFASDTDSEVVAHLIEYFYTGDMLDTIIKVTQKIVGTYAIAILCADSPNEVFVVRNESPLIVGLGNGENFVSSDIPAILEHTRDVYFLENNEIGIINKDSVKIYNGKREEVSKDLFKLDWDISTTENGGYEHFMFKEIMEQPNAILDTVVPRLVSGKIKFDDGVLDREYLERINKVFIVGCGSSYYAGLVGKYIIENVARISVEVVPAFEFIYSKPIIDESTLVVLISKSGETCETISAAQMAKKIKAKTFAIVNSVGSTLTRECDEVLYTWAGVENSATSTKVYGAQVSLLYLLAIYMAKERNAILPEYMERYIKAVEKLPQNIEGMLKEKGDIQYIASKFYDRDNIILVGRNTDYAIASMGAHVLNEIAGINASAYFWGEIRHGNILAIDENSVVIAINTIARMEEVILSDIREVVARGATVVVVTCDNGNDEIEKVADYIIRVPMANELVMPSEAIVPLQLFAYYVALLKGLEVDKMKTNLL
ncbi:MAG: glutamine--fructose-6-phosphate transaminase (isomerizing) [Oscillospiraceae bacterium]